MKKARLLMLVCLCAFFAEPYAKAQAAASNAHDVATSAASRACPVGGAQLSAGEVALARGDAAAALAAYSVEMASSGADADRAHNGRIRALLTARRLDDAETDAEAWSERFPTDSWAQTSLGEVQLRQGKIPEAFSLLQQAAAADLCNAQARAGLARIYALTAMFRTARQLIDSAHTLDPVDDKIEREWIASAPYPTQAEEIKTYLSRATYLSGAERAEMEMRQKRLALAMTDSCQLAASATSIVLPYYMIQNGADARVFWGLQVKINGKLLRLVEDSTISGIYLKDSVVKDAHLDPVNDVEVTGIGSASAVTASVARAASIDIGPLQFRNCDVLIATNDLKVYGETAREKVHDVYLDRGADGLIGPDTFRDFLLTLDKPGRHFRLDPLPDRPGEPPAPPAHLVTGVAPESEPMHERFVSPSMDDWTKEFRDGQFMLFPLRLNQGPVRLYSLATNSILNTVSLDLARQMKIVGINPKELPSMSGHNGQYYRTSGATLDFLGMHERVDYLSAEDMTEWGQLHGVELTGMLGAPMMDQFTVHLDYRDNLMRLDFDPRRVRHCPPNIRMPGCN